MVAIGGKADMTRAGHFGRKRPVPQIDPDLDDADDLTDLLNKLDREASASGKH
jgi:hypothetical protein